MQKLEIPSFETNAEFRKYLLDVGLEIVVEVKDQAMKRGNIKKPEIARAKNSQYKVVLEAIKILDGILKNTQIDEIEAQLKSLTIGLTPGNTDAPIIEVEKLQGNLQELKEAE